MAGLVELYKMSQWDWGSADPVMYRKRNRVVPHWQSVYHVTHGHRSQLMNIVTGVDSLASHHYHAHANHGWPIADVLCDGTVPTISENLNVAPLREIGSGPIRTRCVLS